MSNNLYIGRKLNRDNLTDNTIDIKQKIIKSHLHLFLVEEGTTELANLAKNRH